jgi:hypothetical protein
MKTLAASVAAFALLCSAPALAGDDLTVRVPATGSYKMNHDEFRDYAYTYELSNGKRIYFSQYRKGFYAQLDGEQRTEIFPVAEGVLVTAAGARIEFNHDGAGVTIRNYEKLPMAVAPIGSNITVASR